LFQGDIEMDVQTISIVLGGIGLFIAAINSIISSRKADQQRQTEIETRQAELFMQVYQRFNTQEFRRALQDFFYIQKWEELDAFLQQYGSIQEWMKSEDWITATQIGSYFGGVGVLLQRGLVDARMVSDLMGEYVIRYWKRSAPVIHEIRKTDPQSSEGIETLYNTITQHYRIS
jgi:hypothetical protein